jgi:hypothetical protein
VVGRAGLVGKKFPNTKVGQIDHALYQACVGSGFCTRLDGHSLLKKYGNQITAADFAISVLYSEGMNTESPDHRGYLEKIFNRWVE